MPNIRDFAKAIRQSSGFQTCARFAPVFFISALLLFVFSKHRLLGTLSGLQPFSSAFPPESYRGYPRLFGGGLTVFFLTFSSGILATLFCEAKKKCVAITYAAAVCVMLLVIAVSLSLGSSYTTYMLIFAGLILLSFHIELREDTRSNELFWQSAVRATSTILHTIVWLSLAPAICIFFLNFASLRENGMINYAVWFGFAPLLVATSVIYGLSLIPNLRQAAPLADKENISLSKSTTFFLSLLLYSALFWLAYAYLSVAIGFFDQTFNFAPAHKPYKLILTPATIATLMCAATYFLTQPLRLSAGLRARMARALPFMALPLTFIGISVACSEIASARSDVNSALQLVLLLWGGGVFAGIIALRTKFQIKWLSASLAFICLISAIPALSPRDMFFHYHEQRLLSAAKEAGMLDSTGHFRPNQIYTDIAVETKNKLQLHIEKLKETKSKAVTEYLNIQRSLWHNEKKNPAAAAPVFIQPPRRTRTIEAPGFGKEALAANGFEYIIPIQYNLGHSETSQSGPRKYLRGGLLIEQRLLNTGFLEIKLVTTPDGNPLSSVEFDLLGLLSKQPLPTDGGTPILNIEKIAAENEHLRTELDIGVIEYSYPSPPKEGEDTKIRLIEGLIRLSIKDAANQQKETP
ncbi:MAG TPA: hypothetical protein PLX33_11025 [Alphaproteobacteria bacterium]|nr:hypothetical protein [Alphaproteobacteria bacterium]